MQAPATGVTRGMGPLCTTYTWATRHTPRSRLLGGFFPCSGAGLERSSLAVTAKVWWCLGSSAATTQVSDKGLTLAQGGGGAAHCTSTVGRGVRAFGVFFFNDIPGSDSLHNHTVQLHTDTAFFVWGFLRPAGFALGRRRTYALAWGNMGDWGASQRASKSLTRGQRKCEIWKWAVV